MSKIPKKVLFGVGCCFALAAPFLAKFISQALSFDPKFVASFFAVLIVLLSCKLIRTSPSRADPLVTARVGAVEFAVGLLSGALFLAIVPASLWLLGYATPMKANFIGVVQATPIFWLLVKALWEEFVFRVVILQCIERKAGTVLGVAVSASAFGLVHSIDPRHTLPGAIAIGCTGGLLLALIFAYTRSLWGVWGVHVGVNLVFLLVDKLLVIDAPVYLSGGTHGLSASIIVIVLVASASLVLIRFCRMSADRGT